MDNAAPVSNELPKPSKLIDPTYCIPCYRYPCSYRGQVCANLVCTTVYLPGMALTASSDFIQHKRRLICVFYILKTVTHGVFTTDVASPWSVFGQGSYRWNTSRVP